jgi:hypothetical protein
MYPSDRSSWRPLLRPISAALLIAVGVIGLVLPLIPGIPLLIAGAVLLRRSDATQWRHAIARSGLTVPERLQVRGLLLLRRITTTAESLRLALRGRQRRR